MPHTLESGDAEPIRISMPGSPVHLKQLELADAEAMFAAVQTNPEHLNQFDEGTGYKYRSLERVVDSLVNPEDPTKLRFGIWDDDRFVGSVNLRPNPDMNDAEIGYWISAPEVKKGYTKAAARMATYYALETLGVDYVYARIHPDNVASKGVVTSLGYKLIHRNHSDTYAYFATSMPEAITVRSVYEDSYGTVAAIALKGANTPTINHGSDTRYAVLSGGAMFTVNGEDQLVPEGESILIPKGTTYSDAGVADMIAVSVPPFDPTKVERR